MKTFKFSLVLRTRENTDVFITHDDNIYGIHRKRINIQHKKFCDAVVNAAGNIILHAIYQLLAKQAWNILLEKESKSHEKCPGNLCLRGQGVGSQK